MGIIINKIIKNSTNLFYVPKEKPEIIIIKKNNPTFFLI